MDDSWKYNGHVEDAKRTQNSLVSTSVQRPDLSQLVSSKSSERERAEAGEGVTGLPSPTPSFSSLSQDQADTSRATLSSTSGPDLTSEFGEGGSSPQMEDSRSQVSLGRLPVPPSSETSVLKPGNGASNLWALLFGLMVSKIMWPLVFSISQKKWASCTFPFVGPHNPCVVCVCVY